MMNIEVDINNRDVAKLAVVNRGSHPGDDKLCRYEVFERTTVKPGESVTNGEYLGDVWHYRPDGACKLTAKVTTMIAEELGGFD